MWPFSRSKQYRQLPNYLSSVFTTKQSSCEWYTSTKTQSITVTCSPFIAMFQGLHTTPPALDHFQSINMKGGKLVLNPLEEGLGTRLGESLPSYIYLMFLYMMRTPLLWVCVQKWSNTGSGEGHVTRLGPPSGLKMKLCCYGSGYQWGFRRSPSQWIVLINTSSRKEKGRSYKLSGRKAISHRPYKKPARWI